MLGWISRYRKGVPVVGLQVGTQGQGRVYPGETCLPAHIGEPALRKTSESVLLGPRVLGHLSGVES